MEHSELANFIKDNIGGSNFNLHQSPEISQASSSWDRRFRSIVKHGINHQFIKFGDQILKSLNPYKLRNHSFYS